MSREAFDVRARAVRRRIVSAWRRRRDALTLRGENVAVAAGFRLSAVARELLLFPHRHERIDPPEPLVAGEHVFDVVSDLVDYTGLSRDRVVELLGRRPESFRTEWHSFPERLRTDAWFYLASRNYLFANAVHFHDAPDVVDAVASAVPGGRVLDFGGGSGNLTLALAGSGLRVHYLEISALQKDFVRFRVAKHGLAGRIAVLDRWEPLARGAYDIVAAFDVLEHLTGLRTVLEDSLLPALRPGGLLVEQSPFHRDVSNPMHHEDDIGLDRFLVERGLRLRACETWGRIWETSG